MWVWITASLLQQPSPSKSYKNLPVFFSLHINRYQNVPALGVLLEFGVRFLRVFLVRCYKFCWFSQTRSPFHFLFHRKAVTVALKTNAARDELVQTRPSDLYWKEGAKLPLHICPLMKVTSTLLSPAYFFKTYLIYSILCLVSGANHPCCGCNPKYISFCQQAKTKSQNPFVTFILAYCNSRRLNVKNITNVLM